MSSTRLNAQYNPRSLQRRPLHYSPNTQRFRAIIRSHTDQTHRKQLQARNATSLSSICCHTLLITALFLLIPIIIGDPKTWLFKAN